MANQNVFYLSVLRQACWWGDMCVWWGSLLSCCALHSIPLAQCSLTVPANQKITTPYAAKSLGYLNIYKYCTREQPFILNCTSIENTVPLHYYYITIHRIQLSSWVLFKSRSVRKMLELNHWLLLSLSLSCSSLCHSGGLPDPSPWLVCPLLPVPCLLWPLWRDAVGPSETGSQVWR